jgi:N4-gp56 family major capsid protein
MDTNATLSPEIMAYYQETFLTHATPNLVMKEGAQPENLGSNNGATVTFTRYAKRAVATTPLSTGVNPTHTANTAVNVTATLQEFGDNEKIAKFLSVTSIDKNNENKIQVMGEGMGNTLDAITRDKLFAGATVGYAGTATSLATLGAGTVLNPAELVRVRRTLQTNDTRPYEDKMFLGKIQPFTEADIISANTWLNTKQYSDPTDLYNGEIGSLYQFRFLTSTQHKIESGAGGGGGFGYSNFFHGRDAFGTVELEGDMPQLVIVTGADAGNVAGRFANISWAGSFTALVLNTGWIINWKTSATQ